VKKRLAFALALTLVAAWASLEAFAAVPKGPYLGTWTARLSTAQMINEGYDVRLAGSFKLVLRPNGTYTTYNAWDGASRGTFTVSGRRLVFANDRGCIEGGFGGARGAYTWVVGRGTLRLTAAGNALDPCGGRWQTLTYPVWKKRK
jgi:hypothetical protein